MAIANRCDVIYQGLTSRPPYNPTQLYKTINSFLNDYCEEETTPSFPLRQVNPANCYETCLMQEFAAVLKNRICATGRLVSFYEAVDHLLEELMYLEIPGKGVKRYSDLLPSDFYLFLQKLNRADGITFCETIKIHRGGARPLLFFRQASSHIIHNIIHVHLF